MRAIKLGVFLLVAWFIGDTMWKGVHDLWKSQEPLKFRFGWLALAGLLYFVGMLPCALFWHRILWALGQQPTFFESLRAYHIGHLGKYVPGKALVVVLRSSLVRSPRVDSAIAAASVFLETFTMMATGAGLAAGILVIRFPGEGKMILIAAGLFLCAAVPTNPAVFRRLVEFVLRRWKRDTLCLDGITAGLMMTGWLSIACGWCVLGSSLYATFRGLGIDGFGFWQLFPLCTASVSLALVAGFVSLVPGGFGIRELVLTRILAAPVNEGMAVALAVALRLIWLLSELLFSVILYFPLARRRDARSDPASPPTNSSPGSTRNEPA